MVGFKIFRVNTEHL